MEGQIKEAVAEELRHVGADGVSFVVERPNSAHGDFTTNAALVAGKKLGEPPREVAEKLLEHLKKAPVATSMQSIEVAGAGFINFTLTTDVVRASVIDAAAQGSEWGKDTTLGGKKIMVEYTDPNPFKEMHIGHLMSNVLGEATARLLENEGAEVLRACYQGDVGPHVAKAIWGLQKNGITEPTSAREVGEAYVAGAKAYEDSPEAKAEIDTLNKAVYAGTDHALMELWRKGRQVSLDAFEAIYRTLGTHFDFYFFESETAGPGMRIVKDGLKKGLFKKSEGAVIFTDEKHGNQTLVFITGRGTATYEAKEFGLAFLKEERVAIDESVIVTAAEQTMHFKVFLAALERIAPLIATKTVHVPHGLLRLATGKMSSREGNVVTAEGLIRDMTVKAREKNDDPLVASAVALGAIKFMILRQAPGQDIVFDEAKSLSLEGDSGPYLQYALVRARAVLEKAPAESSTHEEPSDLFALERVLIHYPRVAARAALHKSPNLVVTYLLEVASAWNAFYAQEQIIGGQYQDYKLTLTRAVATTLENGLSTLGIPTLERM